MKNARVEWFGDKAVASVSSAKLAGLTAASEIVQGQAVLLINIVSGNLAGSINYKVVSDNESRVGTNVEYGPYVEFGTGVHAEGGGGRKTPWVYKHPQYGFIRTSGTPARPFLRPALDNNKGRIKKMIGDAIGRAVK